MSPQSPLEVNRHGWGSGFVMSTVGNPYSVSFIFYCDTWSVLAPITYIKRTHVQKKLEFVYKI